jgi:NAD+ kinase
LKDLDVLLNNIRSGRYTLSQEIKLETTINDETLLGLNELQVRAKLPISALRFSLYVDQKRFENLIGDGVVVATPFGSTGYYKSTGGQRFKKGIGISFNNLHNAKIESFVVSENLVVQVEINRGPAWILADNYERFIELNDNDTCTITKSENIAQFIIAL